MRKVFLLLILLCSVAFAEYEVFNIYLDDVEYSGTIHKNGPVILRDGKTPCSGRIRSMRQDERFELVYKMGEPATSISMTLEIGRLGKFYLVPYEEIGRRNADGTLEKCIRGAAILVKGDGDFIKGSYSRSTPGWGKDVDITNTNVKKDKK